MKGKEAVIGSLLGVFIALIILNLYNPNSSITGNVVRPSSDVQVDLQVIASGDAFKVLGSGAKICTVIEMDANTTYYYELVKNNGAFTPEFKYCADPSNNAIIIKFNSYENFESFKSDPASFLANQRNTGYYLFPSKYVQSGGTISCDAEFQQMYCGAAYFEWSKEQMRSVQLGCCADYALPADVENEIETLKTGTVQKPATLINLTNLIITIALLAVFVILVIFLLTKKKQPKINTELKLYVDNSRGQGYTDDQIKESLVQSGWQGNDIDKALGKTL